MNGDPMTWTQIINLTILECKYVGSNNEQFDLWIINLTILECKYYHEVMQHLEDKDNKSNHIGM